MKQVWVPWVAFQCGCELEAQPRLQQHFVGHWARHGCSGELRAVTLIWRGALIIQQLWPEIIAKGFSTSCHCPRICCPSAAPQEFCAPRLSLVFLWEVRPLPWAVIIHQLRKHHLAASQREIPLQPVCPTARGKSQWVRAKVSSPGGCHLSLPTRRLTTNHTY